MWLSVVAVMGLVWLLGLTILVAALVRHIGAIQVVAASGAGGKGFNFDTDGPALFRPLPVKAADGLEASGVSTDEDRVAIFLSSSCGTCWERASEIVAQGRGLGKLVLLVTGGNVRGLEQIRMVLDGTGVPAIYDPLAHDIVKALDISSTPFGFRFAGGRIIAKAYLRGPADFEGLLAAAAPGPSIRISRDLERSNVDV